MRPDLARVVGRRKFVGLGAAVAGSLGGARLRDRSVRASALMQLGGLRVVRIYDDWAPGWDLIVPITQAEDFPHRVLFSSRERGEATLQSFDEQGSIQQVRTYPDWRPTWDLITRSNFWRLNDSTGLILYDRTAGYGSVQTIAPDGSLRELRSYPAWRTSWTTIVPLGSDRLLFYDGEAGLASIQSIDLAGGIREQRSFDDWRSSWSAIVSGQWNLGDANASDLLLYDRAAEQASLVIVDPASSLEEVSAAQPWRSSWDIVEGATLAFISEPGGETVADLLLYNRASGDLVFQGIASDGARTTVFQDALLAAATWSHVVPLGGNAVLFYATEDGRALLARTDLPPVVPTPTPVPTATPTPMPTATPSPSPTPALTPTATPLEPIDQGSTRVVLRPISDQRSTLVYEARATDPRTGSTVISVQNLGDKRVALIHWDTAGNRIGPVFVKADELVNAFDGQAVAGVWRGEIDGGGSEAPNRITLDVTFRYR